MAISLELIKELRERTGVGVVDAKKLLVEAGGSIDVAIKELKKQGQKLAAKKSERETKEGYIGVYRHHDGKTVGIVSLLCETDFVARNEEFQNLAHDIAMQAVAMKPEFLNPESIPAERAEEEKEIYMEQMRKEGKPEDMIEKIVEGKMKSYYTDACLTKQKFFKDDKKSIEEVVNESIQKLGENIQVNYFKIISI